MATNNELLKSLCGITDTSKDTLIDFALADAEEIIKNYCHIDSVPDGLNNTMVRMAADIFRNDATGSQTAPQNVTSVSRGDVSTSFGALSTDYTESLMKNYEKSLNAYRKLVFS